MEKSGIFPEYDGRELLLSGLATLKMLAADRYLTRWISSEEITFTVTS
jgi:hypothetical protein